MYIPAVTIITVVLTLIIMLVVSTNKHLNIQKDKMEKALISKGKIVLDSIGGLIESPIQTPETLSSGIGQIARRLGKDREILSVQVIGPSGTVLVRAPGKGHMGSGTWNGPMDKIDGERGMFRIDQDHELVMLKDDTSGYEIRVALDMHMIHEAQRSDLKHAIFMGMMLLLLGTGAIYFIFVVQNYYVVNRSLDRVETYMKNVVEGMPDALISVDSDGKVVTVNGAAERLLGKDGGSLKGVAIEEIIAPGTSTIYEGLEERGFAIEIEGMAYSMEPEESIPISISASKIRDSDNKLLGTVFIMRDLRDLKMLRKRLLRSEKLAAVGTLASGIAHEIRNPLSSIRGFAHYLRKRYSSGGKEKEYLELMIEEIDRLDRTINDLLNLANPKPPIFQRGDVMEAARKAITLVGDRAAKKGLHISFSEAGNRVEREFDSDLLQQVFLNLLINSIDATFSGGEIEVKAEKEKRGDGVVLKISDTGKGIDEKELSSIFDPFYTRKKGGTGLGLSIVNQIVELHGWGISVESSPGRGTSFQIHM